MTTWFISRHEGAKEWAKQKGMQIDCWCEHLDVSQINKDDVVIGTLPVHLAAEVCAKGAKFYFLSINLNHEQRGHELTAKDLFDLECSIEQFNVNRV